MGVRLEPPQRLQPGASLCGVWESPGFLQLGCGVLPGVKVRQRASSLAFRRCNRLRRLLG